MPGQALVDHGRLLGVLGIEAELLAEVAHSASADTPVPTTPGLTIGEIIRHVGSVYRVARFWMAGGRRPREWQRDPAPGQSAEEYLRDGLTELVGELSAHEPDDRASTWWPADPTYGFWYRRMAHESTIHRVDVQGAAGQRISEIAEDIAIDGVDEILSLWFGQRLPILGLSGTTDGSVAVQAGGHSWIAHAGPTETTASRCSEAEARRADATVSGEPMWVYLWLWGRTGPTSVRTEGHHDSIGQLWALLRLATR